MIVEERILEKCLSFKSFGFFEVLIENFYVPMLLNNLKNNGFGMFENLVIFSWKFNFDIIDSGLSFVNKSV